MLHNSPVHFSGVFSFLHYFTSVVKKQNHRYTSVCCLHMSSKNCIVLGIRQWLQNKWETQVDTWEQFAHFSSEPSDIPDSSQVFSPTLRHFKKNIRCQFFTLTILHFPYVHPPIGFQAYCQWALLFNAICGSSFLYNFCVKLYLLFNACPFSYMNV